MVSLLLAGCGGLTEEERAAATQGARMPDSGTAARAVALAEAAEKRRREEAQAARKARDERLAREEEKRREALRLAMAERAEAEFPYGVDQLVQEGPDGLMLAGPEDEAEYARWSATEERRARAMRERAERYHRRYEREARARGWQPEDERVDEPRERSANDAEPDYLDPDAVEMRRERRIADAERRIRAHQRERERRGALGLRQPGDRDLRVDDPLYSR